MTDKAMAAESLAVSTELHKAVAGLARVQPNCVQRPNSGESGYKNTSQRRPSEAPAFVRHLTGA